MGRIVVTEFVSLDGVMEDPGGASDFEHGGWSFQFERGEDGDAFKMEELREAEVQLLGRLTYDGFAAAWPKMGGNPFGDKMNSMPKYVVSKTLTDPSWENTTVLSGDVADDVARLKQQIDGVILIAGSAQLVQTLIEHDLVDELRLMVFPVLLGKGKRLFGETSDMKRLALKDSRTIGEGIEIQVYEAA